MEKLQSAEKYWQKSYFKWLLLGVIGLVYVLNKSPYVGWSDELSFLATAHDGFTPYTNATHHFLYVNWLALLLKVFFFLPEVLVLTLNSVLFSLLTLGRVWQTGKLLSGNERAAFLPVILLAFSFTWWQQSEIIEVYAFNAFLLFSMVFFVMKDICRGERKYWLLIAVLYSLCLLTHIQNILAGPFFAAYLFAFRWKTFWPQFASMVLVLCAFTLLFILGSQYGGDNWSWKWVFFDSKFQHSATGMDVGAMAKGFLKGLGYLIYNFHFFLFFMIHGLILFVKKNKKWFWTLLVLFIPYFTFAVKFSVSDNHVFFLVPNIILCMVSVYSFEHWFEKIKGKLAWLIPLMLMAGPLAYGSATLIGKQLPQLRSWDEEKAFKGGVVHMLWPGKAWARDPLALARELRKNDPEIYDKVEKGEIEWNFIYADWYLAQTEPDSVPFIYFEF